MWESEALLKEITALL